MTTKKLKIDEILETNSVITTTTSEPEPSPQTSQQPSRACHPKRVRTKIKLEYVWLDGYEIPNLRSKIKVIETEKNVDRKYYGGGRQKLNIEDCPEWGFDGSSTKQAQGKTSDCILKPVRAIANFRDNIGCSDYIVLCEVLNADGTPHPTNHRDKLKTLVKYHDKQQMWCGIEQEYFIFNGKNSRPYNWPKHGFPNPQGRYYCGVGGDVVWGGNLNEELLDCCLESGITISGINGEVAPSQFEFQLGPLNPLDLADELWLARFILNKLAENYSATIKLSPKPIAGDWNGSGAHINFSTSDMRESLDSGDIASICEKLKHNHKKHIGVYGKNNDGRLTGDHETCDITEFKYGIADRTASIRIPQGVWKNKKGYLEDRRPAGNVNPYEALSALMETVCGKIK